MLTRVVALYAALVLLGIAVLAAGGPAFGTIEAGTVIALLLLFGVLGTRRIRRRRASSTGPATVSVASRERE